MSRSGTGAFSIESDPIQWHELLVHRLRGCNRPRDRCRGDVAPDRIGGLLPDTLPAGAAATAATV